MFGGRLGHNELDEPAYTNAMASQRIASLPSTLAIYEKELIDDKILSEETATTMKKEHFDLLDKSLAETENFSIPKFEMPDRWSGMRFPVAGEWETERVDTTFDEGLLREIGQRSVQVPEGFVRSSSFLSLGGSTDAVMTIDDSSSPSSYAHDETARFHRYRFRNRLCNR